MSNIKSGLFEGGLDVHHRVHVFVGTGIGAVVA